MTQGSGNDILATLESWQGQLMAGDVASLFNVTPSTIYRMAAGNRIPSYRIGKCLRFNPKTLAAWLKKKDPDFARFREKPGQDVVA